VKNLPSPVRLKSRTMPTDHGFRFDDDQGRAPTRPQARKPNPKTSISSAEDEPVCLLSSLQHDQLMTERDDLGLHHRLTVNAGEKGSEQHYYKVGHDGSRLTAEKRQVQQWEGRWGF